MNEITITLRDLDIYPYCDTCGQSEDLHKGGALGHFFTERDYSALCDMDTLFHTAKRLSEVYKAEGPDADNIIIQMLRRAIASRLHNWWDHHDDDTYAMHFINILRMNSYAECGLMITPGKGWIDNLKLPRWTTIQEVVTQYGLEDRFISVDGHEIPKQDWDKWTVGESKEIWATGGIRGRGGNLYPWRWKFNENS